jgi:hypothetical protein
VRVCVEMGGGLLLTTCCFGVLQVLQAGAPLAFSCRWRSYETWWGVSSFHLCREGRYCCLRVPGVMGNYRYIGCPTDKLQCHLQV